MRRQALETRQFFTQFCEITTALQNEDARLAFSPHTLALEDVCGRLDTLIDQVLDAAAMEREEEA